MRSTNQVRTYNRNESVVFSKTDEPFGGLSNMAGGFPLKVNGLRILTSEALYQACRFPHKPDVQRLIIEQASPMTAKMKSKPYRRDSRPHWDQVRVKIMRWCLRVKLVQNWEKFSKLLLATGNRPIVEQSWKDDFWGAKPVDDQTLVGMNVLGRLLMELREEVRSGGRAAFLRVEPLAIPDFLLLGQPIQPVIAEGIDQNEQDSPVQPTLFNPLDQPLQDGQRATAADLPVQATLFDLPEQAEGAEPQGSAETPRMELAHALKPYPAYKDSGVPWLGEVPAHWEVKPLKRWVQINASVLPDTTPADYEFRYIDIGTVSTGFLIREPQQMRFGGAPSRARRILRRGDTIVSTVRTYLKAVYHVAGDTDALVCSTGFAVLTPRPGTQPRYVSYLAQSSSFTDCISAESVGTAYPAIAESRLGSFHVPVPPLPEQTAIVRFLDYMDRRIRRYILTKHKLIKLLEEYKQTLIHQVVTGKIDVRTCQPYPAYKPSGVEWLGDVPVHWDIVPNRAVLRLKKHLVGKASTDYTLLSLTKGGIVVRDLENPEGKFPTSFDTYQVVEPGDIIFCLFDIDETPRAIGLSSLHGMITGAYTVFECTDPVVRAYVYLFYLAMDNGKFLKPLYTGLRKVITKSAFLTAKMPLPTKEEQTAIVEYLDAQTAKIDAAIAAARREIELLREYRERLIADVVTGKVDVREVAARLPEEPSEEDAPWTDEEERAQDETLNGEGDHAAISEEDG